MLDVSAAEIAMLTKLRSHVVHDQLLRVASLADTSRLSPAVLAMELANLFNGAPPSDHWPDLAEGVLYALDEVPSSISGHALRVLLAWTVLRRFQTFENSSWSATEVLGLFVRSTIELNCDLQRMIVPVVLEDHKFIALAVPRSFVEMAILLLSASLVGRIARSLPAVVDIERSASEEVLHALGDQYRWLLSLDWRGGRGTKSWEECVQLVLAPQGLLQSGVSEIWDRWPPQGEEV